MSKNLKKHLKNPESSVLKSCLEYLRLKGHIIIRINNGAFETKSGGYIRCTDTPGSPDIMGATINGTALAIECKSNTGRLSVLQTEFSKKWTGLYVVARGIEDLQKAGL